jgi:hypothetical protein
VRQKGKREEVCEGRCCVQRLKMKEGGGKMTEVISLVRRKVNPPKVLAAWQQSGSEKARAIWCQRGQSCGLKLNI